MKDWTGLCIGGPLNGRTIASPGRTFVTPIPSEETITIATPPSMTELRTGTYEAGSLPGRGPVWIWAGEEGKL